MQSPIIPENRILDLTPLAEQWFTTIFNAAVDDDPMALAYIRFDVRSFGKFVVQHIINYCHKRGWANVVDPIYS